MAENQGKCRLSNRYKKGIRWHPEATRKSIVSTQKWIEFRANPENSTLDFFSGSRVSASPASFVKVRRHELTAGPNPRTCSHDLLIFTAVLLGRSISEGGILLCSKISEHSLSPLRLRLGDRPSAHGRLSHTNRPHLSSRQQRPILLKVKGGYILDEDLYPSQVRTSISLRPKGGTLSEPFSGVSRLRQDQSWELRMTTTQPWPLHLFIKLIGQSTEVWNRLHECIAAFRIFSKTHRLKTVVKNAASKNTGFSMWKNYFWHGPCGQYSLKYKEKVSFLHLNYLFL